jgi:hypothetical protein
LSIKKSSLLDRLAADKCSRKNLHHCIFALSDSEEKLELRPSAMFLLELPTLVPVHGLLALALSGFRLGIMRSNQAPRHP